MSLSLVEGEAKVRRRRRKHRALIGALAVWNGKEPDTPNPETTSRNYSVTNLTTSNSNKVGDGTIGYCKISCGNDMRLSQFTLTLLL